MARSVPPRRTAPRRPVAPAPVAAAAATAARPATTPAAWYETSFFGRLSGPIELYNPEVLVARRGFGVFRDMLRDPQVKVVYNLITDLLVARGWRFRRAADTPRQRELEEFFQRNLERTLAGSWLGALRTILRAKAQGFSVTEKVYQPGRWRRNRPVWELGALRWRPFQTFTFEVDVFGRVTRLFQQQAAEKVPLDPGRFVILVNQPDLDPIYGESDLTAAHRAWWEKGVITKFWNIYLERLAAGFVTATPDKERTLTTTEQASLKLVMENVSALTAMSLPPGVKMEVVHGPATDAFERAVSAKNGEIAKALLVPNLLGFSEQGKTGSYAQAATQEEVFFLAIVRQGDQLADALNEQLFRELARWNFAEDEPPLLEFDPLTDAAKQKFVELWTKAVAGGLVVNTARDEHRTRALLGYDEREPDEPPLDAVPPTAGPAGNPGGAAARAPGEPGASTAATGRFADAPDPARDRFPFAAVRRRLDELTGTGTEALATALAGARKPLAAALAVAATGGKGALDAGDPAALTAAFPSAAKAAVRGAWEAGLLAAYAEGRAAATTSLRAAGLAPAAADRLAAADRSLHAVAGVAPATAARYFAARAFWLTGELVQEFVGAAQQVLLNGLRDETTTAALVAELDDLLGRAYLGETDVAGNPINVGARLETVVRTNYTDAFLQAQLSVYRDPALGGFVEALEYSAILDDRTTEFCRAYNGRVFTAADPIWARITPPNHFNCRSVVVPYVRGDAYTISRPLALAPADGFDHPVAGA